MNINKKAACVLGVLALSTSSVMAQSIVASPFGGVYKAKPIKPEKPPKDKPPKNDPAPTEVIAAQWNQFTSTLRYALIEPQSSVGPGFFRQTFTPVAGGTVTSIAVHLTCAQEPGRYFDQSALFLTLAKEGAQTYASVLIPTEQYSYLCASYESPASAWVTAAIPTDPPVIINAGEEYSISVGTNAQPGRFGWIYSTIHLDGLDYPSGMLKSNFQDEPNYDANFEIKVVR